MLPKILHITCRHPLLALWAGTFVFIGLLPFKSGYTQSTPASPRKPTPLVVSMAECARCHREPNKDEPAPILCRCNEVSIWETSDNHKLAHLVLTQQRSQEIGRLLGINDPASDTRCVSCHGVALAEESYRHRSFTRERAIQEGVTCVVCHGTFKEWIDLHGGIDRETWRTYSRKKKEDEFGMTDLWDPVRRAKLCASCHIGDPGSNRIITHAMYAAGHPPLPPFELATFCDRMPRHWQDLREKPQAIQRLLAVEEHNVKYEISRLTIIGAVVAFRASQELLLAACTSPQGAQQSTPWPELAHFDCFGCHQQLDARSWQSSPVLPGRPGRPVWRSWPAALLPPARASLESPPLLVREDVLSALQHAFTAKPFGSRDAIGQSAAHHVQLADRILNRLAEQKWDEKALRQALIALTQITASSHYDFDAARFAVMALSAMLQDLDFPAASRPALDQTLEPLRKAVGLSVTPQPGQRLALTITSADYLQAAQAFDHALFTKEMRRLQDLLQAP